MVKRIYLSAPHMGGNELKYIKEAFETNWIAPVGPNIDAFEEELCDYIGINHGLAVSSATAGIHLALKYCGVKKGDYVFCSSFTFAGSCNPIMYEGAKPVFIDSEPETWNMSPLALQNAFNWALRQNKMPKAVIIVDLYGQSAQYDKLIPVCKKYNVPVIEDAAEALGSSYQGVKCGTFGDINIFSFNGNKIITTSGGGMIVSNNEKAINKVRFWATQARDQARHYQHSELGYNYRLSNVLAGIGRGQLKVLEERVNQKKSIYEKYEKEFNEIEDIEMMPITDFGQSNYWLSVITLKANSRIKPIDIIIALEKENIESRPAWKPMHLQPFYEEYKFFSHNVEIGSVSEDIFNRGVCLPSDTKMSDADMKRILMIIKQLF
ncbi:aminotransferase class I/II-fold pyridoxal phosphate-dependent enzyme [Clostridium sediminicola]|uniref:DegT/DnrJ/EryC1/StrS family aminotransferase n=1 Tax=Clostridium sediminicola TaxID=3114879 RepID=UPI0031F24F3E